MVCVFGPRMKPKQSAIPLGSVCAHIHKKLRTQLCSYTQDVAKQCRPQRPADLPCNSVIGHGIGAKDGLECVGEGDCSAKTRHFNHQSMSLGGLQCRVDDTDRVNVTDCTRHASRPLACTHPVSLTNAIAPVTCQICVLQRAPNLP